MRRRKLPKSAEDAVVAHLLYSQRGTFTAGAVAGAHAHPFWQLEVFESGRTRMRAGAETRELTGGWIALLPPYTEHVSEYLEDGTATTSLKFEVHSPLRSAVLWRGPSSTSARIIEALTGLLPPTMRQLAPNLHVVDPLLSALIAWAVAPPEPDTAQTRGLTAAERARTVVLTCDRWPLSVPQVAAQVGLSASRLSHLFRQQYGRSLKEFADRTRADIAGRHLQWSTMSIKQTAELMGFESLQAFSRFFRRATGASPRKFRGSVHAAGPAVSRAGL
jgi:AraC-like DNA-binding protein